MSSETIRNALIAAVICAAGGGLFFVIHAPLPWMLGSLSAAAICAVLGRRWFMPPMIRTVARPIVGVLAGSAFSAEVLASIPAWWDAIALVAAQTLLVTFLGFLFFRRFARFDNQTAFFAGTPGGLAEMSLLAASIGGNVRGVIIAHTLRVVIVVFSMPFILQLIVGHPIGRLVPSSPADAPPVLFDWAVLVMCAVGGFMLGRVVKFPAGLMIFPMLLSVAVHGAGITQAVPPSWLVAAVQIVIGGVVGARFAGIRWREMGRLLAVSAVWAVAMLALAAGAAYAGTWVIDRRFAALMLAVAPGGMVEMTILTFSIGIEVAFVVTCQVVRIIYVLVLTPVLSRLVAPRAGATAGPDPGSET